MIKPLQKQQFKLFKILQKLSIPQLTKLYKLIESPFFHQTEGVKALFIYLRKFHPHYPPNKVSNEVIAKYLFPESNNGFKKVKNFKTDLIKLIEQFLILQQLSQQTEQQQFLLIQAYQELELLSYADSSFKKLQKQLNESPSKGLPYYRQNLQLLHFKYFHPDTPKTFQNSATLQELLYFLDQYYVAAKYKYVQETLERTSKQNEKFKLPFWKNIQKEAHNFGNLDQQSMVYYYHHLYELVSRKKIDIPQFESIKHDFFDHLNHLDREDQLAIFRYLLNYLMKALNDGVPQLEELHFDLYKKGLAHHLIIWKNRIPTQTFLNIVIAASKLKSFDWLEKFIQDHESYLNPDFQKNVIELSKAFIAFHQGNPNLALDFLKFNQLKTHGLELYCFPLEAKILFEIFLNDSTYYATTLSRLDSFYKKLTTKYKLSAARKISYDNFINYLKSLMKLYHHPKKEISAVQKLANKISKSRSVIHKSWLLEKVEEFIDS